MAGMSYFLSIAAFVHSLFNSRRQLTLENLALRQQLAMLKQSVKRPRVSPRDRLFWVLFSKYVEGWRAMLPQGAPLWLAGAHITTNVQY
jgi:hypothetical protein